jgi:hypothetical protein
MKHEQALLSFEGEEEQGARNVWMDFVIVVGVIIGIEVVVVALVGGTASRRRRFAGREDVVVHGLVLVKSGGEGRERECIFVIVSSSVLFQTPFRQFVSFREGIFHLIPSVRPTFNKKETRGYIHIRSPSHSNNRLSSYINQCLCNCSC